MDYPRILIQFDCDSHPSVFDAVVAIDSQIDHLLQYSNVDPGAVESLVHGAMFTRGASNLKSTAIFVGGSQPQTVDAIGNAIRSTFFGPVSVSVMLDGNGSNTTAAAAVLCAARHVDLSKSQALVLGGTGPVGRRVARLILRQGGSVTLVSRDAQRAQQACEELLQQVEGASAKQLAAVSSSDDAELSTAYSRCNALFGCGAAGKVLCSAKELHSAKSLKVAIDLNAVPPAGIEGVAATDKAVERGDRIDYGAIGVGGLKMRIHRESIQTLFTRNDLLLDAEEIFEIGKNLESAKFV